jgi:hypothetical protein
MSEHKAPDVIVDIESGGKVLQVPVPAEMWAQVTRTAEENGTSVESILQQALAKYAHKR